MRFLLTVVDSDKIALISEFGTEFYSPFLQLEIASNIK